MLVLFHVTVSVLALLLGYCGVQWWKLASCSDTQEIELQRWAVWKVTAVLSVMLIIFAKTRRKSISRLGFIRGDWGQQRQQISTDGTGDFERDRT